MKSFDKDLKKYSEKIALKAVERHQLRERILTYMEYHPLPKTQTQVVPAKTFIPSESFVTFHFSFNTLYARIGMGVLGLIVIVAPLAAEKSLPGDTLYLVKTGINESIQGQLAVSPYDQIEFQTKMMERRISEARVLASEGKLTEDVKTQIAETVKEHTEAVQDGLAELREQDAEGAAIAEIAFNSSLEVQSAVLGANESINSTSSIDSILTVVNDAHNEVLTNQESDKPSFSALMAQTELETSRAYALFEAVKKSADTDEIRNIERRLSDINRLISEAKERNSYDSTAAINDLTTTLGLTQKLIAFMNDISIRQTIELETLVPVVLSDEERITAVRTEIGAIKSLRVLIADRLTVLPDQQIVAKVEPALVTVDEDLLKAGVALDTANIEDAESLIKEARNLIVDLDKLTKKTDDEVVPEFNPQPDSEVHSTTSSTTASGEGATASQRM